MGCTQGKTDKDIQGNNNNVLQMKYVPLFDLKRNLLEELSMSDNHFFSSFITMRFQNSLRKNPEIKINIDRLRSK